MKSFVIGAVFAASALAANAAGSILAGNSGPLGSFSINTAVFNGTSGNIDQITFDLTGTAAGLVFGGSGGGTVTGGGTATLFGALGGPVFGFTFTDFTPYSTFTFSWDPDTAGNESYGAMVGELAGTRVTALVNFSGTTVVYRDTMALVGPDVAANLAPVPEPSSYALMLAGLAGVGFLARRRSAAV